MNKGLYWILAAVIYGVLVSISPKLFAAIVAADLLTHFKYEKET